MGNPTAPNDQMLINSVYHMSGLLLKVKLNHHLHYPKSQTQGRTPSIKDTLFVIFYISQSRKKIIIKNNLHGDRTLDISKDTVNIKERLCSRWLPPFLAVCMLVAAAEPLREGWCFGEVPLESVSQGSRDISSPGLLVDIKKVLHCQ